MAGTRSFVAALSAGYLHLALATLVQVVLLPFLLHRVGTEETGVYLLLMSIGQFASIGVGWLAGAGVRLIGEAQVTRAGIDVDDVHRVVFLGFAVYGSVFCLGCLGAALLVGPVWLVHSAPELQSQTRWGVMLLGAYVLVNYTFQADLSVFVARLEQATGSLWRFTSLALFAAVAIPLMLIHPRIDLLFLAQLASALVCFIGARRQLWRTGALTRKAWKWPDPEIMRTLAVRIGAPYFLFGVAQFVLQFGDSLLVGMVLGPTAVVFYTVLAKAPDLISVVAGRISETLIPYIVKLDAAAPTDGQRRVATLFLSTDRLQHTIGIVAGLAFAIVGPWVLASWVGEQHRPQDRLPYIVAGACIFFQIVNRHDVILHFGCAKVARVIPVQFAEVIGKVLLTLLLFRYFGFVAPFIAYLAMQLLGMTWWYRGLALKTVGTPWVQWFRQVGRPACVLGLVAVAAVLELRGAMSWQLPQVLVFAAILAAVLGVLLIPDVRRVREVLG